MKMLFKQAGGVPRKIRIDNMSTAVVQRKSKFKPAVLTDGFQQFVNHYGFETQICNPRSGNEKGSVENKVGYIRYNFLVTSPIMKDFDTLNHDLEIQLIQDRKRMHYEKSKSIEELWIEEKGELLQLPDVDYPVFKEIEVSANKYNEILLDKTRIHVPHSRNYSVIYAVLRSESYQLVSSDGEIIAEGPRPYMNKKRIIDWKVILSDWRNKLSTMHYSRYWKYLPERIKLYLSHPDLKEQFKRLDQLLNLLTSHNLISIDQHFYELITKDSKGDDSYGVDWGNYDAFLKPTSKKEDHHE